MTTRHLTLRVDVDTLAQLDNRSRLTGQSRSQLAKTLLDEGLRMEAHPGIVFRTGPAGRRPGLSGGPDIWEIARVFHGDDAQGDPAVEHAAALTGQSTEQIRIALRYYAEYRAEIERWTRQVDAEAEQAEAAWQRTQVLLRR
ncbi:MAG: hypothetical protein ACYDCQ_15820 [Dehalococcoidia bacterium]